jgi:uncharacterized repeat protein (TIGR01451 family)
VSATDREADTTNNEDRTVLVVRMPESIVPEPVVVTPPTTTPATPTTEPATTDPVETAPVETDPAETQPAETQPVVGVVSASGDAAERAPNLTIGMYLDGTATYGGRATWHLTVANTGAGDAYDVLMSNALPVDLAPVDVTAAGGICAVTGQLVRCSFDSLHPDETRQIEVSTRVVGRGDDTVVRNSASVSGTRPELRTDDNVIDVATRLGASSVVRSAQNAVDRGVDLPSSWARLWATVLGICGALGAVGLTYRVLVRPRRSTRRAKAAT